MTARIRILFVDDEPNVLAAIQRMLRAKRADWDMAFAESGAQALVLFEEKPFDVIVSDIRMPGMDGAQLLSRIKELYPGVVRIALSGQVDLNEVMRTIKPVHQYISKPCEANHLISRVEGAINSRDILTDPKMQELVSEVEMLPVIPKVFQLVQEELGREEPSIDRVASFIAMDVGLVAKILNLVNSPYFGLPAQIDSIFQAITLLGLETLSALILSAHLFSMHDSTSLPEFSLDLLWEHSLRVSNIAYLIAQCEKLDVTTRNQARMAGFLHDVGKLILADAFPAKYGLALLRASEQKKSVYQCEAEIFGTTHAQTGAYLMGLWGMSSHVVHGIGLHQHYEALDMSVPMLVHIANVIDHHCVIINEDYARVGINKKMFALDGCDALLMTWVDYVSRHWEGMEDFRGVDDDLLAQLRK